MSSQQRSANQIQEEGEIPNGLSPEVNYVPAGEEDEETAYSQGSVHEQEITVEGGLADFFHNPS